MKWFGSGGTPPGSTSKAGGSVAKALVRVASIVRLRGDSDKHVYTSKVRRWAAMADEGRLRELRAAAKRYQLVIPHHFDAESILLELCVTTLQRMIRLRFTVFKTFGNLLFSRAVDAHTGLPQAADYGTIAWKTETEDSPYLVCSDTTSPRLLANFLRYGPWKIARPNLLITIVGGARDFELQPPELARLFSKGFAEAVTTAKAVVTTAGTDAGVAKLVADALANSGSGLPVIGVAPYQKMTGWKEMLDGKNGEEVSYTNLPPLGVPGSSCAPALLRAVESAISLGSATAHDAGPQLILGRAL